MSLGPVERTNRGFEVLFFTDRYDQECKLQASSLADYDRPGTSAVWLGVQSPDPKVMAKDAAKYGIQTAEQVGWVPYPIPEGVLMKTHMHLDREQVKSLIGHLQKWLDEDTFATD